MILKNTFSFILLITLVTGCSSSKKTLSPAEPNPDTVKQFQAGINALDSENYEQAFRIFDALVVKDPTSEFEVISIFNSAAALEGMGRCAEASTRYRRVGLLSPSKTSRVRAQALFRLSYVYECLNEDSKVIATLLESAKRSALFEPEVAQAEIPARLAAAYARMGETKAAKRYLDEAERGVIALQTVWENSVKKRDQLAKTYFLMGRPKVSKIEIDLVKPETFKSYERYAHNLDVLQGYLLRSVFINREPWSQKASIELLDAHESLWIKLQELSKTNSKEDDYPVIHQAKGVLGERALRSLETLKLMRLPDKDEPAIVGRLFAEAEKKERRLREFLTKLGPTNPLTSEARARQSVKKEGRVVGDKTRLEVESLSRKLPSKTKTKTKTN